MSKKPIKETYHKSDYYWDFTRNMSPKEIEKSQEYLRKLEKNRKLHDKYWKDHENTNDSSSVSNSNN